MGKIDSTSLRLGVICAVIHDGQILLSRRGDLNVWALPGGRLDAGERLADAAAREVREETGLTVQVERPIGLYYLAGWGRMNVLYLAKPRKGKLRKTDESRDNRFFPLDALPSMPLRVITEDAATYVKSDFDPVDFDSEPKPIVVPNDSRIQRQYRPLPRILRLSSGDMRALKLRLVWRYVMNALRGRPEPKFPRFDVRATAVIWNATHRVLTMRGNDDLRALPHIVCDGSNAPWEQLASAVEERTGINAALQWSGVWQDAGHNRLEFVFGAVVPNADLFRAGEWSSPRNAVLDDHDAQYVARVKPPFAEEPIWSMDHIIPSMQPGDTVLHTGG
jgi:ADP-ribose pyrophosphatase YjhB (NUDIX family)